MAYTGGKIADLINPQVLAEYFDAKLMDEVKFLPLAVVDYTLQGRPGNTLSIPVYQFIGLASDVAEGEDVDLTKLTATKRDVVVKKAGKGIQESDEAILSAYGDIQNEIAKQLLMAISGKMDNDMLEELRGATLVHEADAMGVDMVADALVKFGEDCNQEAVLMINAKHLAVFRKSDEFMAVDHAQVIIDGEVGRIFNCRVVVSNKVQDNEAFIVREGALGLLVKRGCELEYDRNIVNKTNTYVVDQHFVAYRRDESKMIKITIA